MSLLTPEVIVALAPTMAVLVNAFFTFLNNRQLKHLTSVTDKTHDIINSLGTQQVKAISDLSARVAVDNPNDPNAQRDSQIATQKLTDKQNADEAANTVKMGR